MCLVVLILAVPACDYEATRRQQEELRAELATFPAPDHLTLAHREELGISACIGGDCPRAFRYYVSLRSVEVTCQDVTRAVDGWGVQQMDWNIDDSELNPCTAYGSDGDRYLSVAVFPAERLTPSEASELDGPQLRLARSAVLLDLGRLP